MILTHPGLTKLTFMDYLLTMLRNLLRRKLSYDNGYGYGIRSWGQSRKYGIRIRIRNTEVVPKP